jgi:thioester reductase-like protein
MGVEQPPASLLRRWDAIINAAASTRWTMSSEEAITANVASVLALRPLVSDKTHMIQVSTAYAVGLRGDGESDDPADYRNTYEWSKAAAERVARECFARLTVVRPTLIVGRRCDGRAARFSGMYTLVRGLVLGTVPAIVADPSAYFDAIPVDELGRLLRRLAMSSTAGDGSTLTMAAGAGAPNVYESIAVVIDSLNRWRRTHGIKLLERPRLISSESWNRLFLPLARECLKPRQLRTLDLLRSFEPYLALAEPISASYTVKGVLACLDMSIEYWAEENSRVAALVPRPWRGAAQGR